MYELNDMFYFAKTQKLFSAVILYCIYNIALAVYRVFFHPLAKYPGSKLAASSTEWYVESAFGRDTSENRIETD